MSDRPEGPGWWIASDGRWYPPELHPSVRAGSDTRTEAGAAGTTPGTTWSGRERRAQEDRRKADGAQPGGAGAETGTTPGSTWSGPERRWQGDRRKADGTEPVGPQFPDLFQKAMEGSHLADTVSVRYDGDPAPAPGSDRKGRTPAASAAGGGSEPVSKRRRRKGG